MYVSTSAGEVLDSEDNDQRAAILPDNFEEILEMNRAMLNSDEDENQEEEPQEENQEEEEEGGQEEEGQEEQAEGQELVGRHSDSDTDGEDREYEQNPSGACQCHYGDRPCPRPMRSWHPISAICGFCASCNENPCLHSENLESEAGTLRPCSCNYGYHDCPRQLRSWAPSSTHILCHF